MVDLANTYLKGENSSGGTRMTQIFKDRLVLVAGGNGGLGGAVSLAFLQQRALVAVTYRREEEFFSLKASTGKLAASLQGFPLDATDSADTGRVTQAVIARYGKIDVLVNCIGGYAGGEPLWKTGEEVFDRMLALNLRPGFVLARAIVPVMLKQGHGAIVNIASRSAYDHSAGACAYVASKAAAVAMFDSLAADLKGTGVRVNSVLPSIIDTEANRKAMPTADHAKWPRPEDIARVILFLCGPEAKLIHGASIPVYGNE